MALPWLALGMAGLGAAQGLIGQDAQKRAERANMLANAAAIENSPWTGFRPQMMSASALNPYGAAIGGAAQGGIQGLMFGQQFGSEETPQIKTKSPWGLSSQLSEEILKNQMKKPSMYSGNPWTGIGQDLITG